MTGTSESPPPRPARPCCSESSKAWKTSCGLELTAPGFGGLTAELGVGAVELEAHVGIPPPTLCSLVSAHLPRDCGPRTLARHSAREVGWVFLS